VQKLLTLPQYEHFAETATGESHKDKRRRVRCVVCDISMLRNVDTVTAHVKSQGHSRAVDQHEQALCAKASGKHQLLFDSICLEFSYLVM
jgi:hypothetical protein